MTISYIDETPHTKPIPLWSISYSCRVLVSSFSLKPYIQESFHCETILCGGWFPFLTFIIEITTNKFNPSSYSKDYKHRIPIHNRIKELMDVGLGYKRIHKVLVKEGFKVGKSPNCVNSMIKKRLKREKFLNQKDKCEYKEFKIMVMKRY